ncbi:ABC transporter permease [Fructilactobacillus florum]|uniref:Transport permease protein n=1 Tax=Fructilactobacillus florum DSM 22689 = JCM 16035 TaxID=1423745 RepID=A0A0R2CHD3_9LACO|nr:ABC transporter permease [Fructilactobacillus florum]KRM90530.1 ABC transporter, permease protein [Fructilactobacillus florum DSM 22689 = JCM 16035]
MDPLNFRKQSIGFRGAFIVMYNEINAFFSNLGGLISMTMQPILFFAFLVMGLNSTTNNFNYHGIIISYASYASIGVVGLIMTTQMSQAVYRSTVDKQFGLMAIKFMNGVRPFQYILGMSVFPIFGYLYQCLILYLLLIVFKIKGLVVLFPIAILVGIIMLLFWSSLGIICSCLFKNYQQRDIFIQLVFTPIAFTAPSFYLDGHEPLYLKILANINPMTYQLRALRSIIYRIPDITTIITSLLLTILVVILTAFLLDKIQLTLQEKT